MTDSLRAITGSNVRYADLFTPEETRTAEEVIEGVKGKLRRLGGE